MPDYSRQRAERDFNLNPPPEAPGQGNDGWGSIMGDSSQGTSMNSFTGADTNIDAILNGSTLNEGSNTGTPNAPNGFNTGVGMNAQNPMGAQMPVGNNIGSLLEDAFLLGSKGAWSYAKMVVTSLMKNTSSDWNKLGTRICKLSASVFVVSIILFLFGLSVMPSFRDAINISIGSCFSLIVGLVLVGCNKNEDNAPEPIDEVFDLPEDNSMISDSADEFQFEDDTDFEESPYSDDEESDYSEFDMDNLNWEEDNSSEIEEVDVVDALNNIPDVPVGQYTRQFLFETFSKILPSVNPSFMDMRDISSESDEFMMFDDYLRRSAEQTGINEDKLYDLQLLEVRKNLFLIQLLATRPTGLKEKEIAEGVANCYKHDDYGTPIPGREGVFCRVNSQVGRLIIDIFLCNDVMVSLGDIYRKKSDFILDSKNIMPVVWGVNEIGQVFCYDGMKDGNGGIIISGEARSGKSWKGQSLIAQMCMFRSPKELELYFYDVKGEASDYAYLSKVLPHCKGFCGNSLQFNDSINALLERERTRRTNLLAGKYTNVKDYNKDHPFEQIPTIYIVIDEMATAMAEMKDRDIEIRKRFDSLLIQIATKYPYLELKLLLFPHRIVNDIINKTVSSMISTRSVMGNVPADELKSALDIKKDFPYSLVKTGDMAIKTKSLNNGNAVYSHSEVLSSSEETNRKIFDYIGAVWNKLEPDCVGMGGRGNSTPPSDRRSSATERRSSNATDTSICENDYVYSPRTANVGRVAQAEEGTNLSVNNDSDEDFWDDILGNEDSDDNFDWSMLE